MAARLLKISIGLILTLALAAIAYLYLFAATDTPRPVDADRPYGHSGNWRLAFEDDFNGDSLDLDKWESTWFGEGTTMNNVKTYSKNVSVNDGLLSLQLSAEDEGALIHTGYQDGHYQLPVNAYIEARILFPGQGRIIYNWPAWWVNSTDDYPVSGEHDIAEGRRDLTVNYHSPDGDFNFGAVKGIWSNSFHIYGLYRKENTAEVYYDGKLVQEYPTSDDGQPIDIILNVGTDPKSKTVLGSKGALQIDYVRAWEK